VPALAIGGPNPGGSGRTASPPPRRGYQTQLSTPQQKQTEAGRNKNLQPPTPRLPHESTPPHPHPTGNSLCPTTPPLILTCLVGQQGRRRRGTGLQIRNQQVARRSLLAAPQ